MTCLGRLGSGYWPDSHLVPLHAIGYSQTTGQWQWSQTKGEWAPWLFFLSPAIYRRQSSPLLPGSFLCPLAGSLLWSQHRALCGKFLASGWSLSSWCPLSSPDSFFMKLWCGDCPMPRKIHFFVCLYILMHLPVCGAWSYGSTCVLVSVEVKGQTQVSLLLETGLFIVLGYIDLARLAGH